MSQRVEKYKQLFFSEADEKLTELNSALLALEKKPDDAALAAEAMRATHTLKSSAAAMNFMEISHLAHALEDVLEAVRSKGQTLTPRSIEILFKGADNLSAALAAIKKGQPEPSATALVKQIKDLGLKIATKDGSASGGKDNELKSEILNLKYSTIAPIESIKVDVATLDKIMNLTEELLVEKMRLSEMVRHVKEKPDEKLNRAELESSSEAFNRLISELQLHTTQARMVPLGQIFERFPRMVRDLAHDQNKEVGFEISGQDIELDRTIIDRLGEPLLHLLRNAVDHGIDKTGKIRLTALQERDKVVIEVTNEGRPIDWQKVIEVALARGIIDTTTRDAYIKDLQTTTSKLQPTLEALVYQVSTKEKITETSGRGVGLSIVKSVIESLGGTVRLESNVKGQMSNVGGTKFILSLPLTLAIIQALLVRVGEQTFALPFAQIDRSVRVLSQNIKRAFDQEIAVVEDEDILMMRLDALFNIARKQKGLFLSEEEVEKRASHRQAELMVITKRENIAMADLPAEASAQAGIMIDELLSTQDIVVKPFKGMLRQTKGFAGVTLLGDGKPAMILDVPTLLERLKS